MNRSDTGFGMHALRRTVSMLALAVACALAAMPAAAQRAGDAPASTSSLPDWDRLTPAQRERLIAPLRERWNANPAQRARMLNHAQRWQLLTPEQRQRAHRGRTRFDGMSPEQRAEARAAFQRMRALPEAERKALRETLRTMTPEQRREWLRRQAGDGTR